ncbi:MAG TPA: hypothetical protein VIF15_01950 [Polyangiaceae bacterium]|jgi:hypothetical protein
MLAHRSFLLLTAAILAGCSAQILPVGSTDDGGPPADASDAGLLPVDAATPSTFTAAQVSAARSNCSLPHGPIDGYVTPDELRAHVAGAWLLCGTTQFEDLSGIFTADGNWNALVADGKGGLLEGQGVTNQASFQVILLDDAGTTCAPVLDSSSTPGGCILDFRTAAGGISQFSVSFETSPRRMLVGSGTDWYVALQP